jgi:hypothetical protein
VCPSSSTCGGVGARSCRATGSTSSTVASICAEGRDDAEGLTFLRYKGNPLQRGEIFVANSSQLRAVQGLQRNDFKLTPPAPLPQLRQQAMRAKKKQADVSAPQPIDWKMRFRMERDCDRRTRVDCEMT